ncbi:MAG: hypothetical protein IIT33_02205, partial [Prevotella sp.]|nr:hypothetical protein [Prevotella sp.]
MKKKKSLTKRQFLFLFLAIVVLLAVVRHLPQHRSASVNLVSVVDPAVPHRILSVPNYKKAFPDSQSVQIVAAERWGVRPVQNREDAEKRKKELVYIGESPYWHVDRLSSSIPYLVPRAALLLQDIGQAFYDSLYVKGVPLQQLIVTSVLRSKDDVARLQRHNQNATERSCHLFGTTFDICYNRYHPIERP